MKTENAIIINTANTASMKNTAFDFFFSISIPLKVICLISNYIIKIEILIVQIGKNYGILLRL